MNIKIIRGEEGHPLSRSRKIQLSFIVAGEIFAVLFILGWYSNYDPRRTWSVAAEPSWWSWKGRFAMPRWLKIRPRNEYSKRQRRVWWAIEIVGTALFCLLLYYQSQQWPCPAARTFSGVFAVAACGSWRLRASSSRSPCKCPRCDCPDSKRRWLMPKWLKFRPPEEVPKWQKVLFYSVEVLCSVLFCLFLYYQKKNGW